MWSGAPGEWVPRVALYQAPLTLPPPPHRLTPQEAQPPFPLLYNLKTLQPFRGCWQVPWATGVRCPKGDPGSLAFGAAVHPTLTLQPPPEVPASGHRGNTTQSVSSKRPPSWLARGTRAVSPWLPTFPQRHTGSCEAELGPCLLRAPGHVASHPGSVIRADGGGLPPDSPHHSRALGMGVGAARGVWGSLGPCLPWVGKTHGRW